MIDTLKSAAEKLGVEINPEAAERFKIYASLLQERSACFNLTAITDDRGIALKHFADSLSLFTVVKAEKGASLIDVGTGAGFPGVALLIVRPDLHVTLLDGTEKKLNFISEVLNATGLTAEVLHMRAELAAKQESYRESYDIAVARAVASLNVLSEYCLPFVKVGGKFAAMKGAKAEEELEQAQNALKLLSGRITRCVRPVIDECGERCIIIVDKIGHTSTKYPRVSAQIAKKPL